MAGLPSATFYQVSGLGLALFYYYFHLGSGPLEPLLKCMGRVQEREIRKGKGEGKQEHGRRDSHHRLQNLTSAQKDAIFPVHFSSSQGVHFKKQVFS